MWVALVSSYIKVWHCPKGIDAKFWPVNKCTLDCVIGIFQVALTKFNFTLEFLPNTISEYYSHGCFSKMLQVYFRHVFAVIIIRIIGSNQTCFFYLENETFFLLFLWFTIFPTDRHTDRHLFILFKSSFYLICNNEFLEKNVKLRE